MWRQSVVTVFIYIIIQVVLNEEVVRCEVLTTVLLKI